MAKITKQKVEIEKKGGVVFKGFEGFTQEDITIPRVKIVQKSSAETEEGIQPGTIINSLTKEILGDKNGIVKFIPLDGFKTRIKWMPIGEGGGIDCISSDAIIGSKFGRCSECGFKEFGEDQAPPCTLIYNYPSLIEGHLEFPISISMFKTSIGTAKQFNSLVRLAQASGDAECFARKYELSVVKKQNEKGTYWVFKVSPAGKVSKEEYNIAQTMFEMIKSVRVAIDFKDISSEEDS